jgi:2,2-dialkylglycine decarboxylase (pyruvate)
MWGFESEGVVPDLLTVSKHLGGGLAISAVVTSEEIEAAALDGGFSYAHSHSNDPLSCTAAIAVIDAIEEEGLVDRANQLGAHLRARLEELRLEYSIVGDLRGRGILQGLELVREDRDRPGDPASVSRGWPALQRPAERLSRQARSAVFVDTGADRPRVRDPRLRARGGRRGDEVVGGWRLT